MKNGLLKICISVLFLLAIQVAANAEFYTQSMNMGGGLIQPISQQSGQSFSYTQTPTITGSTSYTGAIITPSTPTNTTTYYPVYTSTYPTNNYITTFSPLPYFNYNPLYPNRPIYNGISGSYTTTGASFAYDYTGHGFDFGVSSGRPIYINRPYNNIHPAPQPPPPPPPPPHKPSRDGNHHEHSHRK